MDKTDIVHALNQYVEKLNIVLKTFKKTTNQYRLIVVFKEQYFVLNIIQLLHLNEINMRFYEAEYNNIELG
jgi:hypothetical protein